MLLSSRYKRRNRGTEQCANSSSWRAGSNPGRWLQSQSAGSRPGGSPGVFHSGPGHSWPPGPCPAGPAPSPGTAPPSSGESQEEESRARGTINQPLSCSSSTLMAPLVPSREVRPRQNSLSELNNKRKSFRAPWGPKTSSGQLKIRGCFISRREGLSLSPEARAEEMGQD